LQSSIYQGLKRELGYEPPNAKWMIQKSVAKKPWMKDWDGLISNLCYNKGKCKCFIKKNGMHFSSGLLGKAKEYFDATSTPYSVVDIRIKEGKQLSLMMSDDFEPRDYQIDTIEKAVKQQRGIIKAATGSGKTACAAGIIARIGKIPFIFYVPSIDLLLQAQSELIRFIRHETGEAIEVGAIGAGRKDIKDISVMTIQTAVKALGGVWKKIDTDEEQKDDTTDIDDIRTEIKELVMSARGFILDEVQHAASETVQIISDASVSAQYRYGMSASPWRDLEDDILIDACFGKCIVNISASHLIKRNFLVKPEIFFVPIDNTKGLSKLSYANVYKQAIVENTIRNTTIAKIAQTMRDNGRIVLILCKQINHGNILEALMPGSIFIHGTHSSKIRKEHLNKMRNREASITIATSIFDEGIDVKPLDTLILAGSGKSSTRALQRVGRILRPYPGKQDALVVDFDDKCRYLKSHSMNRRRIYKTEPEFDIKRLEI